MPLCLASIEAYNWPNRFYTRAGMISVAMPLFHTDRLRDRYGCTFE